MRSLDCIIWGQNKTQGFKSQPVTQSDCILQRLRWQLCEGWTRRSPRMKAKTIRRLTTAVDNKTQELKIGISSKDRETGPGRALMEADWIGLID